MSDPAGLSTEWTKVTRVLDAIALRQQTTAHNLANLETEGFERLELPFDQIVKRILDGDTSEVGQGSEAPKAAGVPPTLETEVKALHENELKARLLLRIMKRQGMLIREALRTER